MACVVRVTIIIILTAVLTRNAANAGLPETAEQSVPAASVRPANLVVEYAADFFEQYQPSTALDMVMQVPGFQIDEGDASRGLGGTLGNILVNDEYLSVKKDSPTALLSRIPASQVERIELIRGQVRGIDLQGNPVVANVILREDVPATVQWELSLLHSSIGPNKPGVSVSLSDRWNEIDFNVGLGFERVANGESGTDKVFDANGELTEIRYDDEIEKGRRLTGVFLNSSTWLGNYFVRLNTKFGVSESIEVLTSERVPQRASGAPHDVIVTTDNNEPSFELGLNAERHFGPSLSGKGIFLFTFDDARNGSIEEDVDNTGLTALSRKADSRELSKEGIARFEFDWTGIHDHLLQMNVEGAFNSLNGELLQLEDTGAGLVPVDIPGANSRVEEVRGDFLVKDIWSLGKVELNYGLGAEVSTISQTGDVEQTRNFFFLKPRSMLIYSPSRERQFRLVVAREVSQLDFSDFVSATLFEDNDLALGNPNLRPETTWVYEASHERRFGADSVMTTTLFYNRISDVVDLLPLTADFEVPGNIGDGTRWGVRFESTMPLDRLGIRDARLDFNARWQKSSVTDPVTGKTRQLTANGGFAGPPTIKLTSENEYVFDIAFRQDFPDAGLAWGWDMAEQADRPLFKVNELDTYDEGVELNCFIETTRWFGVKLRVEGNNLLKYTESRDRIFYAGDRELTPVTSRILRERNNGRRLNITVSGSF